MLSLFVSPSQLFVGSLISISLLEFLHGRGTNPDISETQGFKVLEFDDHVDGIISHFGARQVQVSEPPAGRQLFQIAVGEARPKQNNGAEMFQLAEVYHILRRQLEVVEHEASDMAVLIPHNSGYERPVRVPQFGCLSPRNDSQRYFLEPLVDDRGIGG